MTEYECPSCDYTSEHKGGVSIHHKHKHGESIAKTVVECENCGNDVEKYECNIKGSSHVYCSDECRDDHRSELPSHEQPGYREPVTVECHVCSDAIEIKPWRLKDGRRYLCSRECQSKAYSDWYNGEENPNTKTRRAVKCDWCGDETVKVPSRIERSEQDFCSPECHSAWMAENQHGPDHHQWKGGRREYGPGWNESKREAVRERDGRECCDCGKSEEEHLNDVGRKLDVHHLVPPAKTTNPAVHNAKRNLMTLCIRCHIARDRSGNNTSAQAGVM
jgi:hypothetical protein